MTKQGVVRSAYEGVWISRHWTIQIMKNRNFVTIIIIVSKPLAWSTKENLQPNLQERAKKKKKKKRLLAPPQLLTKMNRGTFIQFN